MKTEQELFEEWYFNKHYAGTTACWLKVFAKFENLKGSEKSYNGKYINDRVLLAYEAWQASANRQGYKLVPVCETCNGYGEVGCQFEGTFTCPECIGERLNFKAMIGAVER